MPVEYISGRHSRRDEELYLNWSFQLKQNRLRDEYFTSLGAKIADLGLEKLDLLPRTAAPHLQEAVNYRVEVDFVLIGHCQNPRQPKRWHTRVTESR